MRSGLVTKRFEMTPPDAFTQLAVTHNTIGVIFHDAGQFNRALHHNREYIRLCELTRDLYGIARGRYNSALVLASAGQFADAKDYAVAALRDYKDFGASAQEQIQNTLELISAIDKAASSQS